jgi:hypothetical protein
MPTALKERCGSFSSTEFTLEDAIESHACSLQANMRVTNGIPLGCSLLLPVDTVNFVQTRKVFLWQAQHCANLVLQQWRWRRQQWRWRVEWQAGVSMPVADGH